MCGSVSEVLEGAVGKAVKENAEDFYLYDCKNIGAIHKSSNNLLIQNSLNKSKTLLV